MAAPVGTLPISQVSYASCQEPPAASGPVVSSGAGCAATTDSEEEAVVLPGSSATYSPYAQPGAKPFIGGYRNKVTGITYHHAAAQTDALPGSQQRGQRSEQASSATQTLHPKSKAVQCMQEAGTQCPRPGWAEDRTQGKTLECTGGYESAAEVLARKGQAAVAIQRCVRGWLARRAAAAMREAKQELEDFIAEQQERHQQAAEQQRQYEMQRRMQPRTAADFVLLYDELAMWWGQEQAKIAAAEGWTEEQRQEARRVLLAKETKLLQTIDRLKAAAAPIVRAERTTKQLASMAAPKQWQLTDGRVVDVATPGTLRAGELAAAYQALLAADGSNMDARLAALLVVKYHVKAFDCSLTREIVSLVDREADLLNRGRDPASMVGLRARLANSFLQFVQTERFNPEAARARPPAAMQPKQYRFTERNAAYGSEPMGQPAEGPPAAAPGTASPAANCCSVAVQAT